MRLSRRYTLHFGNADAPGEFVKLMAIGETPCIAKNTAWTLLERYLQLECSQHLPRNGWRLVFFEDEGVVGM